MDITEWKKFIKEAIETHPEAEIVFKRAERDAQEKIKRAHELSAKQAVWGGKMDASALSEEAIDEEFSKLEGAMDKHYDVEALDKPDKTIFDMRREALLEANKPKDVIDLDALASRILSKARNHDSIKTVETSVPTFDRAEVKDDPRYSTLLVPFGETRDEILEEPTPEINQSKEPDFDRD